MYSCIQIKCIIVITIIRLLSSIQHCVTYYFINEWHSPEGPTPQVNTLLSTYI